MDKKKAVPVKKEFTAEELEAIYRLAKEQEDDAPESAREVYNDYYDEYERPITRKTIVSIMKKTERMIPAMEAERITKEFLKRKYHTFNNDVDEKVHSVIIRALGQLRTVEIRYFNMDSADFTKRKVDVYYTSSKYTIGYCHLRKDIRKFRTSRIASAKLTEFGYQIPENFDKNDY